MLEKIEYLSKTFLNEIPNYFKRYLFQTFPEDSRLCIILGSRGVGKTTAILQYLKSLKEKVLYVPSDHILIENISLYDIANEFSLNGGKVIAFDEIHKYDNWSKELKSIFDTFKNLRVLASGSSSLEINKGAYDLSRRAMVFHMKHMSFREFIELEKNIKLRPYDFDTILTKHTSIADEIVKKLKQNNLKVISLFKSYLKKGVFPLYVDYKTTENYYRALQQTINTIIENDILAVYPKLTGITIKRLKKLLAYLTSMCPFTPDLKKLKNILEITDERTLKQYFYYLDMANVINCFEKSGGKLAGLKKPEKVYLNNTNYIYALKTVEAKNIGNIRESFAANILSSDHFISIPSQGDFLIDDKYVFEIGGKSKSFGQIKDIKNAYVLADDIEFGMQNKIPLWLIGFLY